MDWLRRSSAMRPPEKFQAGTRFCATDQHYEGWKPEPRAYLKGLDVRTTSGRGRDIFLDILFIERNQAVTLSENPPTGSVSAMGMSQPAMVERSCPAIFLTAKALSSGSGGGRDRRFRSIRKRVFMDLTASWAGDLGVQFRHLFFVVVGHPFQESCKRRTAVLAKVVSVLVGHSRSLRVDAKPG